MAFLGTIDPSGWVICDGLDANNGYSRSNADGRYNNLIVAGIGTGTANSGNYTPPNYKGAFLRGIGNSGSRYIGPTAVNISQSDMLRGHQHEFGTNHFAVPLGGGD